MNLTNCIKPYNKSKNKNLKTLYTTNLEDNNVIKLQFSTKNCCGQEIIIDNNKLMFQEFETIAAANDLQQSELYVRYLS